MEPKPTDKITIDRGLLSDAFALITAAKHEKYTGGDVAQVIIRIQNELEKQSKTGEQDEVSGS